jgi:hypothetical protein
MAFCPKITTETYLSNLPSGASSCRRLPSSASSWAHFRKPSASARCQSWWPDGLFSIQKSQYGSILEGYILENSNIFYDHLEYFMDIGDILRTFGIIYDRLVNFVSNWYIFSCFGIMYQEKSGNPGVSVVIFSKHFFDSYTQLYNFSQ